jgi:hypothetical protein
VLIVQPSVGKGRSNLGLFHNKSADLFTFKSADMLPLSLKLNFIFPQLQITQRDILNSIDRETSGDFKRGLAAIGKSVLEDSLSLLIPIATLHGPQSAKNLFPELFGFTGLQCSGLVKCDRLWEIPAKVARQNSGESKKKKCPSMHFKQ